LVFAIEILLGFACNPTGQHPIGCVVAVQFTVRREERAAASGLYKLFNECEKHHSARAAWRRRLLFGEVQAYFGQHVQFNPNAGSGR
jgi:hypothetical protein